MKETSRYIIAFFVLLVFVVQWLPRSSEDDSYDAKYTDDYSSPNCTEQQSILAEGIETSRSWHDYTNKDFCASYITSDESYDQSRYFRNNFNDNILFSRNRYWFDIYYNLHNNDFDRLKPLADSLWNIGVARSMNRNEFASMVVTFVQDIPYSFILDEEECSAQDASFSCVQNQRFGLLGPIEFLRTLKGDCDTRTVLLYSLFRHFNYNPIIVNSWKYLHSMLLLDVATSGEYLEHNGQNFYFWETTAKGWQAGDLPPDMTDLSSWQIILD